MATKERGPAAGPAEPCPLDLAGLRVEVAEMRRAYGSVRLAGEPAAARSMAWLRLLKARLNTTRPMRVWQLYALRNGPLLAAGSAYKMFFAVAAMLVSGFSILGLVASVDRPLQTLIIEGISRNIPGLIDTGGGGLVTPEGLFSSGTGFTWTLVVSTVTMVVVALGWITGLRKGMRGIFGLAQVAGNPVLTKVRDTGTLLLLVVALVATSLLAAASGAALDAVLGFLGIQPGIGAILTQAAGILIMLLLDMAVALVLFRVVSYVSMPGPVRLQAALIAGFGSTGLRLFSSELLANAGRNPLLASYAVILGLFVWFYLLSQVYFIATAWGAVGSADHRNAAGRVSVGSGLPSGTRRDPRRTAPPGSNTG